MDYSRNFWLVVCYLLQGMDLMEQAMEQFGLMMCRVEVVRMVCPSAFTVAGESIIATTMKMPQ